MTPECPQFVSFRVEHMDLCVVESHNDVLFGKMEAGNYTAFLSNVFRDVTSSCPPGGVDEISLFEVRLV